MALDFLGIEIAPFPSLAVFFGFISAILWIKSSCVKLPYKEKKDRFGLIPSSITDEDEDGTIIDVLETAKEQTKWNKWAALAAGLAAFSQVIATVIPHG